MRTISQEELERILKDHEMWLKDFQRGGRADLRDTDLSHMSLYRKNLTGANLEGACLRGATLFQTKLRDANLKHADLSDADLALIDLRHADLRGAKLLDANLIGANLKCADLRGAHLKGSNLDNADLHHTILDKSEKARLGVILDAPIKGFKVCMFGVIVELTIPKGAIVYSINNYQCRTNKAIVTNIYGANRAYSLHKHFTYYIGDRINIKNFDLAYNVECAEGIHFFKTLEEVKSYLLEIIN